MTHGLQWARSLVFIILMYAAMVPYALFYLPWAILSRDGALAAAHGWCRFVKWMAGWLIGLHFEIRGTPPTDEVIVAAKHQSFLDIILIFSAVPRGKFVMKRELIYTPILGQYALRVGSVPVRRGKRAEAVKKMVDDVIAGRAEPGQLVVYPQGTRIAPGVRAPYKMGTFALYEASGLPVVPVACNVGVFWPKRGIYRKPGTAIVEFLPRIEQGLSQEAFLQRLESEIEERSDALAREAGFAV